MISVTTYMSIDPLTLNKKKLSMTHPENSSRGDRTISDQENLVEYHPARRRQSRHNSVDRSTVNGKTKTELQANDDNTNRMDNESQPISSPLTTDEYVTLKIVEHEEILGNVLYGVRWSRYSADEETAEPAKHISQHFITINWARGRREK